MWTLVKMHKEFYTFHIHAYRTYGSIMNNLLKYSGGHIENNLNGVTEIHITNSAHLQKNGSPNYVIQMQWKEKDAYFTITLL